MEPLCVVVDGSVKRMSAIGHLEAHSLIGRLPANSALSEFGIGNLITLFFYESDESISYK